MQRKNTGSPVRRAIPALVATLSMTVFIGLAILAFGLNAFFNHNVTAVQAAGEPGSQVAAGQANIEDLQNTISQYQAREAQYQRELQQAADQITQLGQQNLQYQQLIMSLENAGVIQITQDGRVFILREAGRPSEFWEDND